MSGDEADPLRRRILLAASTGLGGAGLVFASIPFVRSMLPSQRERVAGAAVEVAVPDAPGVLTTVAWRGRPAWVLHRTDEMLAHLGGHDGRLRDPRSTHPQQPDYARNATRSINPRYFVAIGICTHLGCVPVYRGEASAADLGADWPGGFFCPCHRSRFDLAGRVFKGMPAPLNLEIPPHTYLGTTRLLIGQDET